MVAGIERTQKIVRVERLDEVLTDSLVNFDQLQAALAAGRIDRSLFDPLLRTMNGFSGARPSFACFKAEAAPDLAAADWLPRMLARLGLGHHRLASGETGHFALMQYTVEEVFREATVTAAAVTQPFAVPTVLESRNSEFFFPAPAGQGIGYAVDLDPGAGRDWIREFLHIRLTYSADNLARVARLTGPTPDIGLAAVRDAHLSQVRTKCARPEYGAPMSGEVDA